MRTNSAERIERTTNMQDSETLKAPDLRTLLRLRQEQHTEDIGEKGTITQLDTARDKRTST